MKKALRGIALALIALIGAGCYPVIEMSTNTEIITYDDMSTDTIYNPQHWRITRDTMFVHWDDNPNGDYIVRNKWVTFVKPGEYISVVTKQARPFQRIIYCNLPENNISYQEWMAKYLETHENLDEEE